MKNKVVFIGCCKQKLDYAAPAAELYQSPLFRKALAYAERLDAKAIYVLSAEHGIVELDEELEPYDTTLSGKTPRELEVWNQLVWRQLWSKVWPADCEFVFLCGQTYRSGLVARLQSHHIDYEEPLAGLGIGEQLSALGKGEQLNLPGSNTSPLHWQRHPVDIVRDVIEGIAAAQGVKR